VKLASAGTTNEGVAMLTARFAATSSATVCIALFAEFGFRGATNAATSSRTAADILKGDLTTMWASIVLDIDAFANTTVRDSASRTNARKKGHFFNRLGILLSVHALDIRERLNGRHLSE
jgi:hypothetical protein